MKREHYFSKEFLITISFSIFLFVYMTIITTMNRSSTGILDASTHILMYYVDQLFLVAGYFLFYLSWLKLESEETRAWILKISGALMFFPSFIMIMYPSWFAFVVLAPVINVALGVIGGAVNYFVAASLFETNKVGKVLAIGATFAYILQYLVQIWADSNAMLLLLIIAGMFGLWILVKRSWEWILLECLPNPERDLRQAVSSVKIRRILTTVLVMSVLSVCLLTYYDSLLLRLMVESDMQSITAYSWPRLMAILGYVIIGLLGDMRDKRYVNIAFFCLVLWLLLSPVIFQNDPTGNLPLLLFYVVVGATMCYMYLAFYSISPRLGRNAPLFASMSRIIEGVFGVMFSFLPWGTMGLGVIITLGIIAASIMIAVLFLNGDVFKIVEEQEKELKQPEKFEQEPAKIIETEDPFSVFAKAFSLTKREQDVCQKLLFTEDSGKKIADDLGISRRVLQRHVASIYEKTDTKSRVGLLKAYHNSCS